MKITTRPLDATEKNDQSRDAVGLNKWARSSRTINFIMLILGWFTIPAEVFTRKDFGQRWFTVINFYAGLLLLILFTTIQHLAMKIAVWFHEFMYEITSYFNPNQKAPDDDYSYSVLNETMFFFMVAYVILGSYHLFKIWWRNRAGKALHSFDDGTSRLEPVAAAMLVVVNIFAGPFVFLYSRLIPGKQRQNIRLPELINSRTSFANTVVEPLALILLAIWFNGIVGIWLFMTALAVAIHASWKETAKLNKVLDFRDSVLEAKMMMELKNETEQMSMPALIIRQAAETIKATPEAAPQVAERYPDLMNIIDEINADFARTN